MDGEIVKIMHFKNDQIIFNGKNYATELYFDFFPLPSASFSAGIHCSIEETILISFLDV